MQSAPSCAWCADPAAASELARFFVAQVDPSYISHSELQGPRALDAHRWAPDLLDVVRAEIDRRVRQGEGRVPRSAPSEPVLVVRRGAAIVGLGMVSLFPTAPVPYAHLEDLVLAREIRDAGIGHQILPWLEAEARAVGCVRLFLESGVDNERAHAFFRREGFTTCSVVMMKPIAAER